MGDLSLKIAFVIHRYGLDLGGGAELLCRRLAERMATHWEIEIITTCARDYISWKDFYPAGRQEINGITVWRFPVDHPRRIRWFNLYSRKVLKGKASVLAELKWMYRQGPYSTALLNFIESQRDSYHYFLFFTYLYCTTFFGLPLVPEKAILMPTAHDEPPIYLKIFRSLFHLPRGLIYNSPEEEALVEGLFKNCHIPHIIGGLGVEIPKGGPSRAPGRSVGLDEPYLLYIGRVDVNKGCRELLDYFLLYYRQRAPQLRLVLVGPQYMRLPRHPSIFAPGYLPEMEKLRWLEQARAVVIPSAYESLSLTLLEACSRGIPVLVNGACEVLRGHCQRSGAGYWYGNYDEFAHYLDRLLTDEESYQRMSTAGKRYIEENYSWEKIEGRYLAFLQQLS